MEIQNILFKNIYNRINEDVYVVVQLTNVTETNKEIMTPKTGYSQRLRQKFWIIVILSRFLLL